ncbi:50S ribosomal protein L23 [Pedobacter sp. SD-b]|uniref:Large ribosomal subunit protein uL23 n=1 Tax=Pedobacter segetis TaxID=2793069 RepID=A0ABS1BK28_9SPHI|nr:50S ribosomal protein L23 [Pedobacter segetis]MBK0383248.1 50S ribosomal protein L23 [Pedobacter segetis]
MEILRKPVLTEKATMLTEKLNRYTFQCDQRANKLQIKSAIEAMYGVNIDSVNTMVVVGKLKTRSTKAGMVSGRAAKYKKAVVTLKEGEVIDFYSNI